MSQELEQLNRIFEETGRLEGFKDLRLSPQGTATLAFRTGAQVSFEYVADRTKLYLYAPLLPAPTEPTRRLLLLQAMLQCNFLRLDTGAGELALSHTTDEAVYQVELDVPGLDALRLGKAIRELLKQSEDCRYTLESWDAGERSGKPRRAGTSTAALIHVVTGRR